MFGQRHRGLMAYSRLSRLPNSDERCVQMDRWIVPGGGRGVSGDQYKEEKGKEKNKREKTQSISNYFATNFAMQIIFTTERLKTSKCFPRYLVNFYVSCL